MMVKEKGWGFAEPGKTLSILAILGVLVRVRGEGRL
jgi:hypothetical protein